MLVPNIPIESGGKMRVTVIPAKPQAETAKKKSAIKRVAAYCRVSTAEEEQASRRLSNKISPLIYLAVVQASAGRFF